MKKILLMIVPALAVACNEAPQGTPAINLENFDASVSPAENFYQHVTGGWQKNHPLKPEYSRYGVFNRLRETNQEQLRSLIEGLQSQPQGEGSVAQKISTLYAMGLDSAKLNADGFSPIKEQLSAIQNIATRNDLSQMVAALQKNAQSDKMINNLFPIKHFV